MQIEVLRIIAAALSNGSTGVNAQIDALTLDGSDSRPPHVAAIRAEPDANLEVREIDETQFPLMLVASKATFTGRMTRFAGVQDWHGDVVVAYIVQGGIVASNWRDVDYTLRAAKKAVMDTLFGAGTGLDSARKRNNVAIKWISDITYGAASQPEFGGVMTGALDLTVHTRELAP